MAPCPSPGLRYLVSVTLMYEVRKSMSKGLVSKGLGLVPK
jgi:hypothetical protein